MNNIRRANDKTIAPLLSDIDRIKKEISSFSKTLKSELNKNNENILKLQIHPLITKLNSLVEHVKGLELNRNAKSKDYETKISTRLDILSGNIAKIEKDVKDLGQYKTQAIPKQPLVDLRKHTIDVIYPIWKQTWDSFGLTNLSNGGVLFLTSLLSSGNLFIVKNADVLLRLLRITPGIDLKEISASPTWFYESDWEVDIKYIEQQSSSNRILVIHNFDAGAQQAYLFPFLIRWINSELYYNTKIVLIPSENDLSQVYKRLFELAITLDFDAPFSRMITRYGINIDLSKNPTDMSKQLISEILFVKRNLKTEHPYEEDLYVITDNLDLPKHLISNLSNIEQSLGSTSDAFENHNIALYISARLTLFPWILATEGAICCKNTEQRLKTIFGVADETLF